MSKKLVITEDCDMIDISNLIITEDGDMIDVLQISNLKKMNSLQYIMSLFMIINMLISLIFSIHQNVMATIFAFLFMLASLFIMSSLNGTLKYKKVTD